MMVTVLSEWVIYTQLSLNWINRAIFQTLNTLINDTLYTVRHIKLNTTIDAVQSDPIWFRNPIGKQGTLTNHWDQFHVGSCNLPLYHCDPCGSSFLRRSRQIRRVAIRYYRGSDFFLCSWRFAGGKRRKERHVLQLERWIGRIRPVTKRRVDLAAFGVFSRECG